MLHACSRVAIAVCVCATAITAYSQETAHRQITDFTGLARATRPVNNTYPVSGPAHVFISTQWGTVRIVPWAEQIVRVTAEIRVGAATTAVAERIAQSVEVTGNHVGDRIEVRTKYPAIEPPAKVGFETNLEVSVPAGASVEVENTIGAILARGLKGDLVVDARFCDVELADLGGRAGVRMHGQESKLDVQDLHAGGTFELRSTEATFTRVSGSLKVDNYLGGVTLRPGLSPSRLEVSCESGPLQLYLDRAASPDLVAAAKSGKIQSDLALTSETWGRTTLARNRNPNAQQYIDLSTLFADIQVHLEGLPAAAGASAAPAGTPLSSETKTYEFDLPPAAALRLIAMAGNVTIEEHDGPRVEVTQNKFLRVTDTAKAQLAIEALALRAEPGADSLAITTSVQDDMKAIGCTEFRTDLAVRVPRGTPITVRARGGVTKLISLSGTVTLEQETGRVILHGVSGAAAVTLKNGDIESAETTGALDLTSGGPVIVRQSAGAVRVQSEGGNVLIDSPGGAVFARGHNGDVRLIALEGVRGDYDIATEDGNISLAVPESADALFILNVYHGQYSSMVPLTGTSERDTYTGQGRLNTGAHRILLESRRGNVAIDY